ncbi:MAG TPA: hypothetical protein VEG27_08565 [Usitatibacter sp.]|nr:hypothetical protein [Usitatibacter sp.]
MAIISTRPSIALVKTRWRKKGPRPLADRAGVIGANLWKIALEIYRHLEGEGFRFTSDRMVTNVLAELIAFLVPLVDRAVYGHLSDEDRATLLGETGRHLAATMENNQLDLLGPGDYRGPFIDLLNERGDAYARLEYREGEPGFACLRYFAERVAEAMAPAGNKWVVEQMMEIEAPEMVRLVRKLVDQVAKG